MTDDWVLQDEVSVIDKSEYYFALEEYIRNGTDHMVFIHLCVHIWSPSVYKEVFRNWKLFRQCVTCPLFAVAGVEDDAKWERFVERLGFKFLSEVICENGVPRRMYIHFQEQEKQYEPRITADAEHVGSNI